MTQPVKTYLMLGGTFLPAFIGIGVLSLVKKQSIDLKNSQYLLVFILASAIGGYLTSKMIKNAETTETK